MARLMPTEIQKMFGQTLAGSGTLGLFSKTKMSAEKKQTHPPNPRRLSRLGTPL